MIGFLPAIMYRLATDAQFRDRFQASPTEALDTYSLVVTDEERSILQEWQALMSETTTDVNAALTVEPAGWTWARGVGAAFTLQPASLSGCEVS